MKIPPKKKIVFIISGIAAFGFIVYGLANSSKKRLPEFISAARRDVIEEVSATGKVIAENSLDLAFERGGKIAEKLVATGDAVNFGDVLARLDDTELYLELEERMASERAARGEAARGEAGLAREQALLSELKRGAKKEEITLLETKVKGARNALRDSENNLSAISNQRKTDEAKTRQEEEDALLNLETVQQKANVDLSNLYADTSDIVNDAYSKANDAIKNQIDALFDNDSSATPHLTFTVTNIQLAMGVESDRVKVESELAAMRKDIAAKGAAENDGTELLTDTAARLSIIREFLRDLYSAVNGAANLASATVISYQTSVNSAATNINTAIAAVNNHSQAISLQKAVNDNAIATSQGKLNAAKDNVKSLAASYDTKISAANSDIQTARTALASAEDELNLKLSPAGVEEIQSQEARVRAEEAALLSLQARIAGEEAAVKRAEKELKKTRLVAPIAGVVTRNEIETGEIISANAPVISIISSTPYQIEAFIPEIDSAKLELGNEGEVTLDAYGSDVFFRAKIILIDPAETVLEGVPTYKTTLAFEMVDDRVKPGMTANIVIITDKRENVIAVQERVITSRGKEKIVKILADDGSVAERVVETGLRGSDGYAEVTKGLNDGEKIVINQE